MIRFDDDTDDAEPSAEKNTKEDDLQASSQRDQGIAGDESEDEAPLFIPLSWSRVQEGEFYTASDPEWQEFAKISRDRKQMKKLRGKWRFLPEPKSH